MYSKHFSLMFAVLAVLAFAAPQAQGSPYTDAVLADGPLYYWNFDEASGNAIEQVGGAVADELTPTGATRVASTSTAGGVSLGSAADFDGTDDYFKAANLSGSTDLTSYAIEMWVRVLRRNFCAPCAHVVHRFVHFFGCGRRPR